MYKSFFKRFLDFLISGIFILSFFWLFALLAIAVRIKLGSPVIFSQDRPGMGEKIFRLYKFRTMTDARDSEGNLLSDAERLTSFGKFLRSTSLDWIGSQSGPQIRSKRLTDSGFPSLA